MNDVEKAEQTISRLEDKRKQLNVRAVELADERGRIAFGALAEADPKARTRLEKIHAETATLASETSALEAALNEAASRLEIAKRNEAIAADRAAALLLKQKLAKFAALGADVDEAFDDGISSLLEMMSLLNEMHQLGQSAPTTDQFRVNGTICLKTLIQMLPTHWLNDFEFARLAPNQKKSFKSVCAGWVQMITANVAARLGEKQEAA